MKKYAIKNGDVRRYLEPGPIVLVSSFHQGEMDIMAMGWHMIMGEDPTLIGCFIWDQNHSYELIQKSRECVIHIPTVDLAETVVKIGNSTGSEIDKFSEFGLTPEKGKIVKAPIIKECYASFECKLIDSSLIKKYSLFVFEVVAAKAARSPRWPETIHYRGGGEFMISGPTVKTYRRLFRPSML